MRVMKKYPVTLKTKNNLSQCSLDKTERIIANCASREREHVQFKLPY